VSRRIDLHDFSGGLNLLDSPNELKPNETPDATNFTLDERGAFKWRGGSLNLGSLPGTSGKPAFLYFSPLLGIYLCARESAGTLKLFSGSPGTWTDRGTINSGVTAQAAFIDFPGNPAKVVITTDVNSGATKGTWTWDGTTLTNVAIIGGTALVLWQDRAVFAGYPTSDATGNPTRFWASAPKDPTDWTNAGGAWSQDVREKDAAPLTALGVVGGALLVFKQRSAYRINDSATGAYTTIDPDHGCLGPLALAPARGRLYVWGMKTICEFDGAGRGLSIADKLDPLFARTIGFGAYGSPDSIPVASTWRGRVYFAYPSGAGGNDRILEYDPEQQWFMRHQLAASGQNKISSFALGAVGQLDLKAASQNGDMVFTLFTQTPGSDAGTSYASLTNYRTPWLQLNGGGLARLRRARVQGLVGTGTTTTLDCKVYKDWDRSSSDAYAIGADLRGGDASDDQEYVDLQALGHSQAFAFEFVPGTANGDVKIGGLVLTSEELER
jgi:hypothetical protein